MTRLCAADGSCALLSLNRMLSRDRAAQLMGSLNRLQDRRGRFSRSRSRRVTFSPKWKMLALGCAAMRLPWPAPEVNQVIPSPSAWKSELSNCWPLALESSTSSFLLMCSRANSGTRSSLLRCLLASASSPPLRDSSQRAYFSTLHEEKPSLASLRRFPG